MSFTRRVKEELVAISDKSKSELAAIIKLSASLGITQAGLTLSILSENAKVARHIYESLWQHYQVKADINYHQRTNLHKNRVYTVHLSEKVDFILTDLELSDSFFGLTKGISPRILADDDESRRYLRGAFLASGSVKDPESGRYQLEIFSVYQDHAQDLANLMKLFLLNAKVISLKNGVRTYLQKGEDIIDFLIVVGAMDAMATFEEIKAVRETRNNINRTNNVEVANLDRTITASMKTIHNIMKIKEEIGLDQLPSDLQELAHLRLENPDYSMQELANHLSETITKSGISHRLRKLNKIASEL